MLGNTNSRSLEGWSNEKSNLHLISIEVMSRLLMGRLRRGMAVCEAWRGLINTP